jgi:hypothetical protein
MVSTLHLKYSDIFYNVTTLKTNPYLPDIEWRCKRLQKEVNTLEFKKQRSHIALSYFKSQIEKHSKALNSFHISCEREVRVIENLYNEKTRLESIVTEFKNNNQEYIKIKQVAEENVKSVLTNSKILLKFAIASIIESLRRNPEIYDFVLSDDIYAAVILEEAERLYNELMTKLTNEVMINAAVRASSLPLLPSNNRQKLIHKNGNTYYETEEPIYNNQLRISNNDQEQPNHSC